MAQSSENVKCLVLGEFIDDASTCQPGESRLAKDQYSLDPVKALVTRIACEMRVPQFHLGDIVDRFLAVLGPEIEGQIRKKVQELTPRQGSDSHDGVPEKPSLDSHPEANQPEAGKGES